MQPSWSPYCLCIYSSFLILLPALLFDDMIVRILFSLVACISILHHAYYHLEYCGKQVVDTIDKVLVHGIIFYTIYLALTAKQTPLVMVYYACLFYITYIYYIGKQVFIPGVKGDAWHVSFHFFAILGTLCLLWSRN